MYYSTLIFYTISIESLDFILFTTNMSETKVYIYIYIFVPNKGRKC